MMTGQFGKSASVEPLSSVLTGAGKLTTGAINGLDGTKTFAHIKKVYNDKHGFTIMGSGHLSMYMGAGAVKVDFGTWNFKGKENKKYGTCKLIRALGAC